MKRVLIIAAVILIAIFLFRRHKTQGERGGGGTSGVAIENYRGKVAAAEGNVLTLTSGVRARLIGVAPDQHIESFLKNNAIGKRVRLVPDSHDRKRFLQTGTDTVNVYVSYDDRNTYCINRLAAMQNRKSYRPIEIPDSIQSGWVKKKPQPVHDLALFMKPRTFEVRTPNGLGTGFFINENGLAVTNYHVMTPAQAASCAAIRYKDDPHDTNLDLNKVHAIKSVKFSSPDNQLDLIIFEVALDNNQTVPYFDISDEHPRQGDFVATYGNPKGLPANLTKGYITAFREDEGRRVKLIQYSIDTNGGNSGGPVVDESGQIVAIHELGDKDGQALNFGIDASQLRDILDRLGLQYGGQ